VDEDGERVDPSEVTSFQHEDGSTFWEVKGTTMPCEPCKAGWYWWFCFPGCMPDSEPEGPYRTERAAVRAMRKDVAA
jgi:hypothetical protein